MIMMNNLMLLLFTLLDKNLAMFNKKKTQSLGENLNNYTCSVT